MNEPRLEVADVFPKYGAQFLEQYGSSLSIDQKCVFKAILACQTSALGGHRYQCDHCTHELVLWNSCRNRHCTKCQAMDRAKWMEARAAELLPIPYFHVTITLSRDIRPIALQNKTKVYGIFMRAAAQAIKELAADPKHLGDEVAIVVGMNQYRAQHLMILGDLTGFLVLSFQARMAMNFFPREVLGTVHRHQIALFMKDEAF